MEEPSAKLLPLPLSIFFARESFSMCARCRTTVRSTKARNNDRCGFWIKERERERERKGEPGRERASRKLPRRTVTSPCHISLLELFGARKELVRERERENSIFSLCVESGEGRIALSRFPSELAGREPRTI